MSPVTYKPLTTKYQ